MNKMYYILPWLLVFLVAAGYPPGFKGINDFFFEVEKDNVIGHKLVRINGHDASIPANTEQTLMSIGGIYEFPPDATIMSVSSNNTNDTSAGTAARTVRITYLDSLGVERTEDVILNGQTGVNTSALMWRINKMEVLTSGVTQANSGVIYIGTGSISSGTPATIYNHIEQIAGMSRSGVYTVPSLKTLFLTGIYAFGVSNKPYRFWIEASKSGTNTFVHSFELHGEVSEVGLLNLVSEGFEENTDIRLQMSATSNQSVLSAIIDGVIVNKRDTGRRDL